MSLILNLIWLVFGGFWLFLGYAFFGFLALLLVVTAPAGFACWRIAGYVLWPFGRVVVRNPDAGVGSALMNVVWFFVAGFWISLEHVITAFFQAVTIIGIPLAVANLKLIPVTCFRLGSRPQRRPPGGILPVSLPAATVDGPIAGATSPCEPLSRPWPRRAARAGGLPRGPL